MGKGSLTYISKGGIGSRNIGPLGRGQNIGGNKYAGVRTAAACLGELTTERGKGSLFEMTELGKVKNIVERKKRKRACTTIVHIK